MILCSGQSNMGGVAKIESLPEELKPVPANVLYFTAFDSTESPEPLKSFAEGRKFGSMPSFLHALSQARPKDRFIVLQDSVGGSALASWVPDYGPSELTSRPGKDGTSVKFDVGKNYRAMAKRLALLQKSYPEAKPLAFLWIQGEADKDRWASAYLENFQRLVANTRRDMKSQDVFVIIGEPGKMEDSVRQAFADYIKADPKSSFVATPGLVRGDGVHYDPKGYIELGQRLAKALEEYLAKHP